MKCFRHAQSDAVGTCKFCFKGVCAQCATDTGVGIACSPECQQEVKLLKAIIDRNKQAFPLAAKANTRNAILLFLFGFTFLGFGAIEEDRSLLLFFGAVGVIMLIGGIFSLISARKYAKSPRTQS